MSELTVKEQFAQAPPVSDIAAVVAFARQFRGPEAVAARREAEDKAIELLNASAGSMNAEQALALGRLFNTDQRAGEERHDRFAPAFHGATWNKVTSDLELFNLRCRTLWRDSIEEALACADTIFLDSSALPGSGRSFPTMLLYLRDRTRFAVWLTGTARGLAALTNTPLARRTAGVEAYLKFCERAQALAGEYDLAPQEMDGVLAIATRIAREKGRGSGGESAPQLSADAFAFLSDLRDNNSVEWMQANQARYKSSLDTGVDPPCWTPDPGYSPGEGGPWWVVQRSIPRSSGVKRSRCIAVRIGLGLR